MSQDKDQSPKAQDLKTKTMIGTVPPGVQQRSRPPVTVPGTPSPSEPPSVPSSGPVATRHPAPPTVRARPSESAPYPVTVAGAASRSSPSGTSPPGSDGIVGQVLGSYIVRRRLAEGGMGVVYEGEHRQIGRLGAIKVLRLELCGSEEMVERFRQEALAVSAIRHENIVDVFDFGRDRDGRVFFVMEYLEGEPLSARIARGPLTWVEAFPVLEQTLRALKAAHDKGYVHRDLKPDNIWLKYVDGGIQIKLLDFGIAKLVGSDSASEKLTRTGTLIGTPHYMSPEQINGSSAIDRRTDLYALGVITYEMFAGVTPFVGDTLQAIMGGHLFTEPPRLANIPANLAVPPPIAELVARMLAKQPDDRYASAADVLDDLHDVNRHQWPTHAGTLQRMRSLVPTQNATLAPASPAVAPAPRRRGGRIAVFVGLAIAAIAATAAVVWKTRSPEVPVPVATTEGPTRVDPLRPLPPAPPPPSDEEVRRTARDTLRASLREPDTAVRVQGSDALGKIKDRDSTPELGQLTEHDPDANVRGHAGEALGTIGASSMAALLARLETGAEPGLKVWYSSALARLGDRAAFKRLLRHARSPQLDVSFTAALKLAELSRPGDKPAIDALWALLRREAEVNEITPDASSRILTRLAALRDARARKLLYGLLESTDEGARLDAARGLARLGDDAGKQVFQDVLANQASPNRLMAAVWQIPLGEYGGRDVILQALAAKDPAARGVAARALGDIGDRKTIDALLGLAGDKEWPVRIAAATALVVILGIDPVVLAQASVDWTRSALDSDELAVRKAAAGVLADIPVKDAVPLLAKASADRDATVRLTAARAAGRMKNPEAAATLAVAVTSEADPRVKEQQVKALGEIGEVAGTEARTALAALAEQPGRLGVIAGGSLIAVGDTAGRAKLEAAVAAHSFELRSAAVEAASTVAMQMTATAPNRPLVIPTLKIGILDREFTVRFSAAEGLASFDSEKSAALPVLKQALDRKDSSTVNRALAALARLGEPVDRKGHSPAEMLDLADPKQRLAAVPIIRALATAEAVPLLRRVVADLDQEVRYAGIDAIEMVIPTAKDEAIKLYRPLVNDADPVVRSKAAGQLSRLVPRPAPPASGPVKTASAPAAPDDTAVKTKQAADAALAALTPALDAAVARLAAPDAMTSPADALAAATSAFDDAGKELARLLAGTQHDEAAMKRVDELKLEIDDAAGKLREAAAAAEAAARPADESAAAADTAIDDAARIAEAAIAAGAGQAPSSEAAAAVEAARANLATARSAAKARAQKSRDDAAALVQRARDAANDIDRKLELATRQVKNFRDTATVDPSLLISSADFDIGLGKLADARRKLDTAARQLRKAGSRNAKLHYSYGELYRKMADDTQEPAAQRTLFKQAEDAYREFTRSGSGPNVQRANAYLAEIAEKLKALPP